MSKKSMMSRILVGFAVLLAAFAFTTPAQAYPTDGTILYVEDVVRSTEGDTVETTGDLYIRDLETNAERQITNLVGTNANGAIINPQFTPDGKFIFFTYSEDTTDLPANPFKAYKVSIYATLAAADIALAEVDLGTALSTRYAAVSNNYNGTSTGLIAHTRPGTGGRTDIWLNDLDPNIFPKKIRTVAGETVRHITFLDNANIAFVGINIEGVQNIYTMNVSTLAVTNLTGNGTNSPLYGRLVSPSADADLLAYSKATWAITSYTKYDVFVRAIGAETETNVTLTNILDEFEPALHGTNPGAPADDGTYRWMYYANGAVFQANYSTDADNTNLLVAQVSSLSDYGLLNWSPVEVDIATDIGNLATDIANTTIVNANTNLFKRTGPTGSTTQLGTLAVHLGADITLDGGTILYIYEDTINSEWEVGKMSHDANVDDLNVYTSTTEISHPRISSDGQWVVYLKEAGLEVWVASLNDITGTETVITTSTIPIDPPSFNPDMTGIIYAKKQAIGNNRDVYTTAVVLDPIAGTVAVGAETPRTNRSTTNDRYPAYSNDGTKVLFKSDLNGSDAVYRMDVSGTNLEAIAGISGTATYLRYLPVYDEENGNDGISYMDGGTIYTAYLNRETGAVTGATDTGIANEQFGCGKVRTPGTVVARRYMTKYSSTGVAFEYDIVVDVDETAKPVGGFTLSEVIPSSFTLNGVTALNGGAVTLSSTLAGQPYLGLTTYKILFHDDVGALDVEDNVLRFQVVNATPGPYAITGTLLQGTTTTDITGNVALQLSAPYMPFDLYDNYGNATGPDGAIDDADLLYAIECWKYDTQLDGVGAKWPANTIDNYNGIILAAINIWSTQNVAGNYMATATTDPTQVVSDAQTQPGEYVFLGDGDSDGILDLYAGAGGAQETVWQATTAYILGNGRRPDSNSTGLQYRVTVAGTSGGVEPDWPTVAGETVVDGTVTWEAELVPTVAYEMYWTAGEWDSL